MKNILIYSLLTISLLFFSTCKKDNDQNDPNNQNAPIVSTSEITDTTSTSAICGGNVSEDNGAEVTERGVCWSTSQNPTISDNKTTNGSGLGVFESTLTELEPNTEYFVRAYATNAKGTGYGENVSFSTQPSNILYDTRDGKEYRTVTIGEQTWMAQGLNYETASNSWCYNNDESICENEGRLYTWSAIMNGENQSNENPSGVKGICPDGWHIPSDAEIVELTTFIKNDGHLGYDSKALKDSIGWAFNDSIIGYGTNEYGFGMMAGGNRYFADGGFYGRLYQGRLWSCTEYNTQDAIYLFFFWTTTNTNRNNVDKRNAFELRCVKD